MATNEEAPFYVDIDTYTNTELFEREKRMLFKRKAFADGFF